MVKCWWTKILIWILLYLLYVTRTKVTAYFVSLSFTFLEDFQSPFLQAKRKGFAIKSFVPYGRQINYNPKSSSQNILQNEFVVLLMSWVFLLVGRTNGGWLHEWNCKGGYGLLCRWWNAVSIKCNKVTIAILHRISQHLLLRHPVFPCNCTRKSLLPNWRIALGFKVAHNSF